jgi:succinyl-diaminopimelate desuccinylase
MMNRGIGLNGIAESSYIELLKRSIQIKTVNPPGDEETLAKIYVDYLNDNGIDAWLEPVKENRSNFVAKISGLSSASQLVFCGHMDTVPIGTEKWIHDPFLAVETEGKIYGRGTSDMKSGLAAMIAAFVELKKSQCAIPYNLYLLGTVGEEIDCLGSRSYLGKHSLDKTQLLVIGEPTDCTVITQQKGAAWIKVSAFGRTAHGSMPEFGENAIYYISTLISELACRKTVWEKNVSEVLGTATISVNQISGGLAPNMVADECSILIDFRLLPGQSLTHVKEFIENILNNMKNQYPKITSEYSVINYLKPIGSPKNCKHIQTAIEINELLLNKPHKERGLNFYTDASVLTEEFNFPVVFYGPGNDTFAHQINEYVDRARFLQSIEFYKRLAVSCEV